MASRKLTFRVEVDLDRAVTQSYMAEYIAEAVRCWAKGGHPDDPLFDLTEDDLRVVAWRERRKSDVGEAA